MTPKFASIATFYIFTLVLCTMNKINGNLYNYILQLYRSRTYVHMYV